MRIELKSQSEFWAGINAIVLFLSVTDAIRCWFAGSSGWFLYSAGTAALFGIIVYNDFKAKRSEEPS